MSMEYRQLGRSGLRVSCLTLGTMTFGGRGQFQAVGETDVEGARRQIDMALDAGVNLIDNAVDAVGKEGTITLRTRRDGDCIVVDVADSGPGIPDEVRPHVYEPFFTTKDVGKGTGLGLDTARRIVEERHSGSLAFDTGEQGTTFHVWLPLK